MSNRARVFICLSCLSCLLFYPFWAKTQNLSSWQQRGRLQIGIEYDNNIKEARSSATEAQSLRIMFHYTGRRSYSTGSYLKLNYQGGYQGYWDHADENKLINELSGEAAYRVYKKISIGVQTRGRFKIFLNDDIDYFLGNGSLFSDIYLPMGFISRLSFAKESLDYAQSDTFDFSGLFFNWSLNRPIRRWISLTAIFAHQKKTFNRMAFEYNAIAFSWLPAAENQIDKIVRGGLQLNIQRGLIFNLIYTFDSNQSNSYGFSFVRHRLQALLGTRLPLNNMLRLYVTLQRKKYSADLDPFIPLELDTEREESNFAVIDLSRKIVGDITVIWRTAWYDNESPVRALYYNKFTSTLSLEYKF